MSEKFAVKFLRQPWSDRLQRLIGTMQNFRDDGVLWMLVIAFLGWRWTFSTGSLRSSLAGLRAGGLAGA